MSLLAPNSLSLFHCCCRVLWARKASLENQVFMAYPELRVNLANPECPDLSYVCAVYNTVIGYVIDFEDFTSNRKLLKNGGSFWMPIFCSVLFLFNA